MYDVTCLDLYDDVTFTNNPGRLNSFLVGTKGSESWRRTEPAEPGEFKQP